MNLQPSVGQSPAGVLLHGPHYLRALLAIISRAAISIDCALFLAACPGRYAPPGFAELWHALTLAPPRGLHCRALLQQHSPRSPLHHAHTAAAFALAAAGWRVRMSHPARTLHAKFWIVDTRHVLIGSHNLTGRALAANVETSIHVDNPDHALNLRTFFSQQWATATPEPTH